MKSMKTAVFTVAISIATTSIASAETFKIAFIDPLSGPFGPSGSAALEHWEFAAETANEGGGIGGMDVEIVGYDNKINPTESLVQLQKAIDEGIRVIVQGNGSSVASALIDAVEKHNVRNPGEEILFLNYAAVDPAFTNDRCSFWHFRFDSDADMKMEGVTDWIQGQPDIQKVYIIGQDYSFGKAVAAAAVRMLGEKRPDIEIVGNELHPLGKVKDFTPYIQKIINSEADAVITGNWGADMVLLVKAATDSGHNVPYLTYYGGSVGAAVAMGDDAVGLVKQMSEVNTNLEMAPETSEFIDAFEAKYAPTAYYYHRVFNTMAMLDDAVDKAGSTDPIDIAFALEGATYESPFGTLTMREDNHQILQPLFMSTFSNDVERGVEGLSLGWASAPADRIEAENTATETTCQMERPERG